VESFINSRKAVSEYNGARKSVMIFDNLCFGYFTDPLTIFIVNVFVFDLKQTIVLWVA
jgi:hypothetical protein